LASVAGFREQQGSISRELTFLHSQLDRANLQLGEQVRLPHKSLWSAAPCVVPIVHEPQELSISKAIWWTTRYQGPWSAGTICVTDAEYTNSIHPWAQAKEHVVAQQQLRDELREQH